MTAPDPAARSDAGDGPVLNRGVPMAELSADDAIAELARIARDLLAQTSGVSYREAFETLRDSLLLIRKARADGAAEERERIAEKIEAEADGTFNEPRARHFRTAAGIVRGTS